MTMTKDDPTLLARYLDVTNAVFAAHRDELPVMQQLELGETALEGRCVRVVVTDESGARPHRLAVRFRNGRLSPAEPKTAEPGLVWLLSRRHMEHVVETPEAALADPQRLDWGWMQASLGEY